MINSLLFVVRSSQKVTHLLPCRWGQWWGQDNGTNRESMAKYQREATQYPGVFWLTIQRSETLYIRYKRPGTDKAVEEKLGSKAQGGTTPRGNAERAKRIN